MIYQRKQNNDTKFTEKISTTKIDVKKFHCYNRDRKK